MAHGVQRDALATACRLRRALRRRGLAVLLVEYRHFGDSGGEPAPAAAHRAPARGLPGRDRFAKGLDGIRPDPDRAVGSSFSGAATSSRSPPRTPRSPPSSRRPRSPTGWPPSPRRPAQRAEGKRRWGSPTSLGALAGGAPEDDARGGAPGSFAAMTAPSASPASPITGEGSAWRIRGRGARDAPHPPSTAGGQGPARACPLLVPSATATRRPRRPGRPHGARAPRGELVRYPIGHFDIYTGPTSSAPSPTRSPSWRATSAASRSGGRGSGRPWPGASSSRVGGFGGSTPRAPSSARCRRRPRRSRSSTTSTSCSTRRCCPARRRGRSSRATSSCRCARSSTARPAPGDDHRARSGGPHRQRALAGGQRRGHRLRPPRARARVGLAHVPVPASPSTPSASRRCPTRSRCATACWPRSRRPRRSRIRRSARSG